MSQHPYPQQPYYAPPPPSPVKPVGSGLAVSSLVLGIVGVVLSFMPIVNNLTAAGAFVGLVLGFIGMFKSKQWTSAIGVVLCGAAIVLTVVAQQKLSDELDRIGDNLGAGTEQVDPAVGATPVTEPEPAPAPPAPAVTDFTVALVVTDKQCFGSAGCVLTVTPEVTYGGLGGEIPDASITYTVAGDDSGEVIQTIDLAAGGQYSAMPLVLSTANSEVAPTATVTAVR